LITGGANGIGEGTAKVFVDAGARVMICDVDADAGTALARQLTENGPGKCVFESCDVSRPDEIEAVIERTIEHFGQLDCLFNNAGYHPPFRAIEDCTLDDLDRLWRTNFVSQFVACKYALPHLRKTIGSIINMSSCTAVLGQEGATMYAASKGAISAFTKSLAIDEATHGVRVNAVLPGNIYTKGRAEAIKAMGKTGLEVDRWAEATQPVGRSGTPEEAGQVVLFLASEAASFLTGVELVISAGIELGVGIKYPPIWI
jgi:NAD(P)-dependent dehydrogenase (short-subunit alcohol dehydrogenase family)